MTDRPSPSPTVRLAAALCRLERAAARAAERAARTRALEVSAAGALAELDRALGRG